MKKMKKLTALLLTLVMSLALAVPCFAAEPQEDAGDALIATLQTADNYHVEYVGGCRVTTGTISIDLFNEIFAVSVRDAGTYNRSGTVTPTQNAYVSYSYSTVYGYRCLIRTDNTEDPSSSTACLDAEYTGTINGVPYTYRSRGIEPGQVFLIDIDRLSEGRLEGSMDGTIMASLGRQSTKWAVRAYQY